ncbi:variant 2, Protein HEADING DATE REPRESSOR 1 [Lathyrus oleraceus]|uniref:Variant 2, Protein HEADING DATE REPRESSOR 1 n=1 Tax=Pisum sativum TaxID=3888 RepID=A0A9D4VZJ6_PEA|nr:variant 2, Protein HEADING DATE REPRESSOR 1 [Pisum sativum]
MVMDDDALNGFSPISTPMISWKSRRRSASGRDLEVSSEDNATTPPGKPEDPSPNVEMLDTTEVSELSERRKALFEPLEPIKNINGRRPSAESLLPPPDFESANYPKGWLIGKKRKLVNVDVVEKMRRIAVQEMNRKGNRWTKRTIRGGFAVPGAFASATCGRTKQTLSTRKRKQYASRTSEHAYEHDTRN